MKELKVSKILPSHVGFSCRMPTWVEWWTIDYVGKDLFVATYGHQDKGFSNHYECADWLIRNPAEKEKKPSERISEILLKSNTGSTNLSLDMVNAVIVHLDEQFSKDHHE